MKVIRQLQEAMKLEDLRKRLIFVIVGFGVFMIGRLIPLAQVDTQALENVFGGSDSLFGLLNMFSGGALEQFSVFALGVMPYINASIMFQLLTVAVPSLKELQKEGETGRRQIGQWTRWLTVGLAIFQGFGLTQLLRSYGALDVTFIHQLQIVLTVTAGSMFLLWLGEEMTEHGIGNGVSLIIFIGIMASLPTELGRTMGLWAEGVYNFFQILALAGILIVVLASIIIIQQGERQIRVQYARRQIGTRMTGGASTYLPMKVNQAGVMPIIFAISVALFPATITNFLRLEADWWQGVRAFVETYLTPGVGAGAWVSLPIYFLLVVGFTYFYTAVTYDPVEVADNLKKWGGQIKGIRAGGETARYIDRVLTRVTFAGAIFLGIIALLPYLVPELTGVTTFGLVGGTSLLIVVGVALETMQQIEAHLMMRHYKGFIG